MFLDNRNTVAVVPVHDVAGDLDQEGVKQTPVPLTEHVADFFVA
jgi:hypothetical protein